jgi:phage-related protein
MGVIIFNGLSSQDLFKIERPPDYEFAEKDYEAVPIPGRNGDLTLDKGSYKNVDRSYDIAVGSIIDNSFTDLVNRISEWLHSTSGYARLEDSYEPNYYKMARYSESGSIKNILQKAGRVTITFNRKLQRFLKSGDTVNIFNSVGVLNNPTNFVSLPIITVIGSGTGVLRIGNYVVNYLSIGTDIIIDSEVEDAYDNALGNQNGNIELVNKEFPKLTPGENEVSFSGGITSVHIVPKLWTL